MTLTPLSNLPNPTPLAPVRQEWPRRPTAKLGKTDQATQTTAPILLLLFVMSIIPPVYFHLGETRLSLTRIFLLITFLPLCFRLFSGKIGPLRAIDVFLFLFSGWIIITILFHEGLSRIPFAGMQVVELLGGYLVGRVLILNAKDYRLLLIYLIWSQLFLLPFAILEFLTNINLLHDFFALAFSTFEKSPTQTWRNGYARVMSGFEHPILFGLFCSLMIAPLFYLYRISPLKALLLISIPIAMTYMSLSSAPLIGAGLCVLMIIWDLVTGSRWKPLIWMVVILFVFLSITSNRGPIVILIDTLTFNAHTAWTRIWTFNYGSAEVMRNPIFGIGLRNDWTRPAWLTPSVDNFWLLIAMRHGLTGIILFGFAIGTGMWAIVRTKNLNQSMSIYRTGYVIALVGLYFSLTTVHIWGDTSALIMCFIGAGMWLCTAGGPSTASIANSLETKGQHKARQALPTTRFEKIRSHSISGITPESTNV